MGESSIKIKRVGQVSNKGSQSGMVYDPIGLSPTICACTHGYAIGNIIEYKYKQTEEDEMNKIIREIIPLEVRVRKFDVDIKGLQDLLRGAKKESRLTNKTIAEKLERPLTMVEHWFRTDSSFSIPSDDIWYELKRVLGITDDSFDESIMTFELREGAYDKSNRVYDSNGIAPTLTCVGSENERIKEYINLHKRGDNKMRNKHTYKKFDFIMEDVTIFDSFAGIGALHQSLKELGVPTKLMGMSEVEPDAIISYAIGHIDNFMKLDFEYPSEQEMREWLMERNIGYSFEKQKSSIPRMKKDKLRLVYKASVLTNNLGDISKIDYDSMEDFDMFNMSFPCTDVSNSGRQKGMTNEDGSVTRSGLYVFGVDLIRAKRPKYVMIENVKGLIQKKFIGHFYDMVSEIEDMGYVCYYPKKEDKKGVVSPRCLNAKDYGVPQNRERIFVICVRKDVDEGFEFPEGFDSGVRLRDILEDEVDEKYYLSQAIQDRFKLNGKEDKDHNELNVVGSSAPETRTIGQRDITYGVNGIMSTLVATDYKQPKQILDTRKLPRDYFIDVKDRVQKFEEKENYIQWDVSGKGYNSQQDRAFYEDGNIGTIPAKNAGNKMNVVEDMTTHDFRIRKLTPKECWRLQGFRDEYVDACKDAGISDTMLYKQAGNSIAVPCLYYIFKSLFKNYIVE